MSDWRRCQEWTTYSEITQYTATSSNRDNAEIQTKDMTGVEGSYDLYKETRGLDATAQCWHVNQLSEESTFTKLHLKAFQNLGLTKQEAEGKCVECWRDIRNFITGNGIIGCGLSGTKWDTGGRKHLPSNKTCGKGKGEICAECYICKFKITKESGTDAIRNPTGGQCEHIIPVASLSTICTLPKNDYIVILSDLVKSNPTLEPADKVEEFKRLIITRTKVLLLLFDWAHPKCNIIKSDYPFINIEYTDDGYRLVVNNKTILYILCEIFKIPKDFEYLDEEVKKGKFTKSSLKSQRPSSLLLLNQGWKKQKPNFCEDEGKRLEQLKECYTIITDRLGTICDTINGMREDTGLLHYYALQTIQSCINKKCQVFGWRKQKLPGIANFRRCFSFYYKAKLVRGIRFVVQKSRSMQGGASGECPMASSQLISDMKIDHILEKLESSNDPSNDDAIDLELGGLDDNPGLLLNLDKYFKSLFEEWDQCPEDSSDYVKSSLMEFLLKKAQDDGLFTEDFDENDYIELCLFYIDYLKVESDEKVKAARPARGLDQLAPAPVKSDEKVISDVSEVITAIDHDEEFIKEVKYFTRTQAREVGSEEAEKVGLVNIMPELREGAMGHRKANTTFHSALEALKVQVPDPERRLKVLKTLKEEVSENGGDDFEGFASEKAMKMFNSEFDSLSKKNTDGGGGNFSRISSPISSTGELLTLVKDSIKNLYKNSLEKFFVNTNSMEMSNGETIEIDVVNGFEDNYMMEVYFKTFKHIDGLKQSSRSSSSRPSSSRSSRSKKKSKRKKRLNSSSSEGGGKNKSKRLNNKRSKRLNNKRSKRLNNNKRSKRTKRRSKRRFS